MSDPEDDAASLGPGPGPRLDRAPGERYAARHRTRTGPGAPGDDGSASQASPGQGVVRGLVAADVAAAGGAIVLLALGQLDIGPGLLAVAAAIGWVVALALLWGWVTAAPGRATRMLVAAGLGAVSIIVGLALNWAWSRVEGGVLGPLEYLDQRYGIVAYATVVVAAVAGALRAR